MKSNILYLITALLSTSRFQNFIFLINKNVKPRGKIASAAVLLESDEEWTDRRDTFACYIRSLVTDTEESGAGKVIMAEIEKLAIREGNRFLRLDCAADSTFLNGYYKSLGYTQVEGKCAEGKYVGNRFEKEIPFKS